MTTISNVATNGRSLNGILSLTDGVATLEDGDLNCDDINSATVNTSTLSTNVLTCNGQFRSNINGPYTIPVSITSLMGSLLSYGNTSGNGATDFTNYGSTYNTAKQGFNFWNLNSTQPLSNLAIIDNTQTYFKSQLVGCTAETPLNTTSVVNKSYCDNNFVNFTSDQTITGTKRFNIIFTGDHSYRDVGSPFTNRLQSYLSGTTFVFTPLFASNSYRFYTRDGASTETIPLIINSASTTIANNLISNGQAAFNNNTPICSVASPTANDQLTRKDYIDNNFMFKTGSVTESINGIKTFTNRVNFNGSPCLVATGTSEFTGANGYFAINPNMGSGTLNAASEPGTIGIIGLKDQTTDKVLFTLYGTTHVSVKLSFTGVSMGFGGQSQQGNTSVTCDGTNVIIKPNIKFSGDNTIQSSAFTGAGSLNGTYNLSNVTIDTNGKITSLSSGLTTANTFTNTNTFNAQATFNGQATFNNNTPISTVATPTAVNHLTRKDYVDNNFVDKTSTQSISGNKTFEYYLKTKQGLWLYDAMYPYTNFMELSLLGTAMQFVPSFNSNSYQIYTNDAIGTTHVPITINDASTTLDHQLICNNGAVFNTTLPTSTINASSSNQFTIRGFTDATYATIASLTSYLTTSAAALLYQEKIVGSIIQMAANVVPSGYLECNGASVSNSTYGALFSVIGYTYGGSGAIFLLPDFRGMFLRGKGTNGIDPTYASSTNYGFLQTDGIKAHTHDILFGYLPTASGGGSQNAYNSTSPNYNNPGTGSGRATGLTSNNANPYPDTRPANYAVLFCIKY